MLYYLLCGFVQNMVFWDSDDRSKPRGASLSGANVAGAREPRFGGRHRTSRSRVRCYGGLHRSEAPR